jgi:TPP-dependent indolepyruvate ferredoxin oxidoreductase alpha subunit
MNKRVMELKGVEVWDGNMANSQALRQADVDVVAAYPITPSTATVENYAMFHANGYVDVCMCWSWSCWRKGCNCNFISRFSSND